jgi:hypothetical protein
MTLRNVLSALFLPLLLVACGGGTNSANSTSATSDLLVFQAPIVPDATVGASYGYTLVASGGKTPYSWSLTSGTLPNGLTLSSTGALSGIPTASGSFAVTLQVRDSSAPQQAATSSATLKIMANAVTIATSALPAGTLSAAYSATLSATGGIAPLSWTGLTLNANGSIGGTPTSAGNASFAVTVLDSATPAATHTAPLSIAVSPSTPATLTILTTSLPAGSLGSTYSATVTGNGGTQPYSWSLSAGTLPAGLVLSASSGSISGTPTAAGTFTFTLQLRDSTAPANVVARSYSLAIGAPALVIATTALPSTRLGDFYTFSLAGSGGIAPYSWSIAAGALPAGYTLSSGGTITGTSSTAGSISVTVRLADSGTPQQVVTRALTLTVNSTALSIGTSTLPDGIVGVAYTTQLMAAGGTQPYGWSIQSGSLPAGLTLSAGGVLSGTPTAAGVSTATFKVVDSAGAPLTATAPLAVRINPAPLVINTTSVANGTVAVAYGGATLSVSGGIAPYSWTVVAGSLPTGLTLASNGTLSGTPTAAGSTSVTIQASDAQSPAATATRSFSLTINPAILQVSTASLPSGQIGSSYSAALSATGGTSPYNWSLASGTMPSGLALSANGVISGTPTATAAAAITVQVVDSQSPTHNASRTLTLNVSATAVTITTSSLVNGNTKTAYNAVLAATGGVAPYSWTITSGSLPAGLSLNSNGTIAGTPTAAIVASFTVQAADSQGAPASATRTLTLTTYGTASLSWTAPTLYEDGSSLVVNGYTVLYGTNSGSLTNTQQVTNASAVGSAISNLAAGTWYFSVVAYDAAGVQSIGTGAISVVIP